MLCSRVCGEFPDHPILHSHLFPSCALRQVPVKILPQWCPVKSLRDRRGPLLPRNAGPGSGKLPRPLSAIEAEAFGLSLDQPRSVPALVIAVPGHARPGNNKEAP
jgi:hypothetical protein